MPQTVIPETGNFQDQLKTHVPRLPSRLLKKRSRHWLRLSRSAVSPKSVVSQDTNPTPWTYDLCLRTSRWAIDPQVHPAFYRHETEGVCCLGMACTDCNHDRRPSLTANAEAIREVIRDSPNTHTMSAQPVRCSATLSETSRFHVIAVNSCSCNAFRELARS